MPYATFSSCQDDGMQYIGLGRSCSSNLAKSILSSYLEKQSLCALDGTEICRTPFSSTTTSSSPSFTRKQHKAQLASFVTYRLISQHCVPYSALWICLHHFYSHRACCKLGKENRSSPQGGKCYQPETAENRHCESLERGNIPNSRPSVTSST